MCLSAYISQVYQIEKQSNKSVWVKCFISEDDTLRKQVNVEILLLITAT